MQECRRDGTWQKRKREESGISGSGSGGSESSGLAEAKPDLGTALTMTRCSLLESNF